MSLPTAVLLCPGRGSYARGELGFLGKTLRPGPVAEALDASDAWRNEQQRPTIRELDASSDRGLNRVAWDLRFPAMDAVGTGPGYPDEEVTGFLAAPGSYTVSLSKTVRGETTELVAAQPFEVERLREGALPGAEPAAEGAT